MSEYYDLGTYSRAVTTGSSRAQLWFDRGLAWTYGYNHDEAIACYRKALEADPECAMAWWGIAYAAGPNYNKPWEAFDEHDARSSLATAFEAVARAVELSDSATQAEKALIRALRSRYPSAEPAADMCPWNDAYAGAMRAVHEEHGDDPDNVWSLHGYHECLERLGHRAEAAIVGQRLRIAMARTDVPVTASCFCRLNAG